MKNYLNASAPDKMDNIMRQAKKPSSSDQLAAMQAAAAKRGTAEQEAAARKAGYKNYNEQTAYLKNKQTRTGGTVQGEKKKPTPAPQKKGTSSAMRFITDTLRKANEPK